ncbi:MAG: hypothetical protein WA624_09820 [Methylocella sp.]
MTVAGVTVVDRPVAHMMAVPACVPFDETVVKVPPSWPLTTGDAAPSWTKATVGEVCIFQTVIWGVPPLPLLPPPLLTTRPTPSGPVK